VFSDGVGLPVDFVGAAIPGDVAIAMSVDKPAGAAQATLEMAVTDANFPDEGELFVNGEGPIPLFGANLSPDARTASVSYDMPAAWWQDGENTVRFTHLKTPGFRIERASLAFDNVPPAAPPSEPQPTAGLVCGLPASSGETVFIAPDGSDDAAGTKAKPFKTFKRAVAALQPGDTLILEDGTYTFAENSGDPNKNDPKRSMIVNLSSKAGQKGKPITIRAMHPGKAILDGQKTSRDSPGAVRGIGLHDAQFINIAGIKVTRSAVGVSIRGGASDIILSGMEIAGNGHWKDCVDKPGGFGLLYDRPARRVTLVNSVIHSNGRLDPDQHCDPQVANNKINGWDQGLYLQGGDLRIENNIFYNHKGGFHIKIMGYDGADIDGHTVVITNNLFYGVSGKGITGEAKIRRGAIIPWENEPGQFKTAFPLIQNNIFFRTESPLDAAIVSHRGRSANWPQNDAFNNVTTSKKLVDSSTGSDEEKREVIGRWRMAENKLNADPLLDLKESFLTNEPLRSLAKANVGPSSPIINAGRRADAPPFDFFCRARDAQVDVGPFEFRG
jgi:Right handed beta helix region